VRYRSTRGHLLDIRHNPDNWLPIASVNNVPLDFDRARISGAGARRYPESDVGLGDLGLDGFRSGVALTAHF